MAAAEGSLFNSKMLANIKYMPNLFNHMAYKNLLSLSLLILLLAFSLPSVAGDNVLSRDNANSDSLSQREMQNLYAFTKVYGYAKYFYPLKKKERINWGYVASHGAKKVMGAKSDEDLRKELTLIFGTLAPLLEIHNFSGAPMATGKNRDQLASAKEENATRYYYNLHHGLGLDREDLPFLTRKVLGNLYKSMVVDVDKQGYQELVANGTLLPVDSTYSGKLNENLICSFPIVVTEDEFESNRAYKQYNKRFRLDTSLHEDRIATMVIFWNVFQHFYPYKEHADNWDEVFFRTMRQLTSSTSQEDFFRVGNAFAASLKDGHASFSQRNGTGVYKRSSAPAIQTAWAENKLIISKVNVTDSALKPGDIIEQVNDKDAEDLVCQLKESLSVANQNNASLMAGERILNWVGMYSKTLNITVADSTGNRKIVQVGGEAYKLNAPAPGPAVKEIEEGIYYIDAARINGKGIEDNLQMLKQAKGIIFDLRNRPSGSFLTDIMPYLIEEEVETGNWAIPHYTFPDQRRVSYKQVSKWHIKPNGNYLNSNKAFLIGHNTISYGETCAELVDHYRLGTTIGSSTAGTNGNINFTGVGKLQIIWTGMRVLKRDGSPYHGVGVEPDIVVQPFIKDIRSRKDAQLKAAVSHLKKQQSKLQLND